MARKSFFCIDAHTCGNPVRVVAGGGPDLKGETMNARREHFLAEFDWIRTGLMLGAPHHFRSRVEQLLEQLRDAGQERLPGDRRYANRCHAQANGIALTREEYDKLLAL